MNDRRLRVLFVCALNQWRSVTAEKMYRNDARLEVRSAGVRAEARRRVSADDVAWADVIYVMERSHQRWIAERFAEQVLPPIDVLEVTDDYLAMDLQLQDILKGLLDPDLAHRCELLRTENAS